MKRFTAAVILTGIFWVAFFTPDVLARNIKVFFQGRELAFDARPVIENGRLLVPVRPVFEALGATVNWDSKTKTVHARMDNLDVAITVNDKVVKINNRYSEELDVPARIVNDLVMVPLRFAGEVFGAEVDWDGRTSTANIYFKEPLNFDDIYLEKLVQLDKDLKYVNFSFLPDGNILVAGTKSAGNDYYTGKELLYFYDPRAGTVNEVVAFDVYGAQSSWRFTYLADGRIIAKNVKLPQKQIRQEDMWSVKTAVYQVDPWSKAVTELFTLDVDDDYIYISGQGDILYDSFDYKKNLLDIFKIDLQGKSARLTYTPDIIETHTKISPDGKKVAFVAWPRYGQMPYISVVNDDGTGEVKFNFSAESVGDLMWSVDSRSLVYETFAGNKNELWIVKADGTGRKKILSTDEQFYTTSWSPDGTKVAAAIVQDGFVVVNTDGTGFKWFKGAKPAWSPDGKLLLYERYGELWIWDPAEDRASSVVYGTIENFSWSADGKEIYISAGNEIWRVSLE